MTLPSKLNMWNGLLLVRKVVLRDGGLCAKQRIKSTKELDVTEKNGL